MKPAIPRSTLLAERILVVLCLMTFSFFTGQAFAPEQKLAACIEIPSKQMSLNMPREAEMRWIKYWKSRGAK